MNRRYAALAITGLLVLCANLASAQAPLLTGFGGPAGFGVDVLPPEDDNSSPPVSLTTAFPSGLEFFGTRYTELNVNNNGNVSFAGPLVSFTPMPFPVAAQPIIALWWADVDTRGVAPAGDNRVYWYSEPGRFIATWYRVGFFDMRADVVNNMQLVLTDQSAAGAAGDFDVEFRYNLLGWTTGDASGGVDGLGGTPAQAGFDAGNSVDFLVLPGSLTAAVLDLAITSNVGEPGVWRFQVRSGGVAECGNGTRERGEACDDGNTNPGDGCSARCEIELADGSACRDGLECISSFCAFGVCCDRACDQGCEACSAAGRCDPVPAGTVCGPAVGPCDAEELCDGTTGMCPPDAPAPDGTDCGNGIACDGDEICVVGACTPGAAPVCDDGDVCTADMCVEPAGCASTPIAGCRVDAGVSDAGPSDAGPFDAGGRDAGIRRDADVRPRDAGPRDAAAGGDAGSMDGGLNVGTPAGSGLSCAVGSPGGSDGSVVLLALLAAGWARRRRRGGR